MSITDIEGLYKDLVDNLYGKVDAQDKIIGALKTQNEIYKEMVTNLKEIIDIKEVKIYKLSELISDLFELCVKSGCFEPQEVDGFRARLTAIGAIPSKTKH